MLRADLLLGRYATVEVLHRYEGGELVRAAREDGEASVLFLPLSEALGLAAQQTLGLLAGAGIPRVTRRLESAGSTGALVLDLPPSTRPLGQVEDLPPVTLREGLIRLLVAVSRAHSRGLVHGRISRASVLACDSGEFWLVDWLGAHSPDESDARRRGWTDVSLDLQALARAFAAALRRETWPADSASTPGDVAPGELRFPGLGPDFGRVLGRLLSPDPRECYAGATEVLSDLGYPNTPDPWVFVPYVESDSVADVVDRHLDASTRSASEDLQHAASIEILGPHGAGKTRALEQVARRLRERGVLVLQSSARAPGAWGGIGSVARQLAQLLGRTHAACREHVAVLDVLFGRSDSGPPDFQTAATAAISNIVSSAFADRPGALLIDDLDDLRPAELDVWSAVGRYVCAVNDDGQGVRVVLVGSRRRRGPDDVHGPREVIELREWSVARLEEFLSSVLGSAIAAEETAPALHAAAGGRPGELVEYLRHLERGGGLVREGACWRLETPLHELGSWTPGIAEYVRRSVASCPREARSLVEVLSSAEHARLSRGDCGQLAEVTGPSLWKAADDAIAAGLLRMDGSSWRLRTEAIRRKVYASLPDARRRSLHRELLFRLLRREPQDCVAIAHHARSCGDASAAEWTSRALTQLEAANDCTGAIRALEHAAESLGEPDWGRTQRLRIAVLQRQAGRLRGSVETLERVIADPLTPPPIEAEARLRLAEAHFHAREWDAVLSVELPRHTADPDLLAQIRLLRATSLTYLQRASAGQREARLAAAETGASRPSPTTAGLALEYRYLCAFSCQDWPAAARLLVQKMRRAARDGAREEFTRDLTRYANVQRYLGQTGLAKGVLGRVEALIDSQFPCAVHLRIAHAVTLGHLKTRLESRASALPDWTRAHCLSLQTGSRHFIDVLHARVALARRELGDVRTPDTQFLVSCIERLGSMVEAVRVDLGVDLASACVAFARQRELDELSRQQEDSDHRSPRVGLVRAIAWLGRLLLGEFPDAEPRTRRETESLSTRMLQLATGTVGDARPPLTGSVLRREEGPLLAIAGALIRRGGWDGPAWPRHWTVAALMQWLARDLASPGGASLALGLSLWVPIQWDMDRWCVLVRFVRARRQELPLALDWEAVLLEGRECWRVGATEDAARLLNEAEGRLEFLASAATGDAAAHAVARGRDLIARYRQSGRPSPARLVTEHSAAEVCEVQDSRVGLPAEWESARASVTAARRVLVYSRHSRELSLFLRLCGWVAVSALPEAGLIAQTSGLAVVLANLLPESELLEATARARDAVRRGGQVLVAVTDPPRQLRKRGEGGTLRMLLEIADGARVDVPQLCSAAARRATLFQTALAATRPGLGLDARSRIEIRGYSWPGGYGEMEAVASELAARSSRVVTLSALNSIGWEARVARDHEPPLSELDRGVLSALSSQGPCRIRDIARSVGRPPRSVLRYVRRLSDRGLVRRTGRGRATRYELAPSQA